MSIDPKPDAWQSHYTSMDNNPIWHNDPLGDDVGYNSFGDRVRVGVARIFSKKARTDFRSRKASSDLYVYKMTSNMRLLKNGGTVTEFGTSGGFSTKTFGVEYSMPGLNIRLPRLSISVQTRPVNWTLGGNRTRRVMLTNNTTPTGTPVTYNLRRYVPGTPVTLDPRTYPDSFTVTDATGAVIFGPTSTVNQIDNNNDGINDRTGSPLYVTNMNGRITGISSANPGPLTVVATSQNNWQRVNGTTSNDPTSNTAVIYTRFVGIRLNLSFRVPTRISFNFSW